MQFDKLFYKYNKILIIVFDLLLISFSFLVLAWEKPDTIKQILPEYKNPFFIFALIWLGLSFLFGKYDLYNIKKPIHLTISITSITFIVLSIVSILLFAFKLNSYSRLIVFGTILLCYILELISFRVIYGWIMKNNSLYEKRKNLDLLVVDKEPIPTLKHLPALNNEEEIRVKNRRKKLITLESGTEVLEYISEHVNIDSAKIALTSTTTPFNIENLNGYNLPAIINLKKVNDLRSINKFFIAVNHKLCNSGIYIGCFETNKQRSNRIARKFPKFIRRFVIMADYLACGISPKFLGIKNIYLNLSSGIKNMTSKAEVLGRLVCCGFEIIEYKEINNLTYFVVTKAKKPGFNHNQSYGSLFKMARIGMGGEMIHVYKFRTMYPYSEYLQDYVLNLNGYSMVGKPADDFRLTKWGKFLRKYWLDELPQLVNVLRGEMNLVGIRPLSRRAFEDYPDDVKEMRIKYKPGCIPPYISLLKQGMEQSIEAERTYLLEKEKNPFATDFKYFKMAVFNIITNKIRSA